MRFREVPGVRSRWGLPLAAVLLGQAGVALPLSAQDMAPVGVGHEIFVGDRLEDYLRVLQTTGGAGAYPWTVRGFGLDDVARLAPRDSAHPWAGRYSYTRAARDRPGFAWVQPTSRVIFNSTFPFGDNDGALWAGRGVTGWARVGFAAHYGAFSAVFAPELFHAQNASFPLAPRTPEGSVADPAFPRTIDLPQRFGDNGYSGVSTGQSTLRLDAGGVAIGISSANQHWGPAWDQPLILGSNAAGFPHGFLGTSRPARVGIGRFHGRVVWGALEQSEFAPAGSVSERRFMAGWVVTLQPGGLTGLELGASRFFHEPWPVGGPGLDEFLLPFQSFLKESLRTTDDGDGSSPDNQLASVFARWLFPRNGAEVYGEYAREDHNWDIRDFVLEPDHDSAWVLGLARTWILEPARIVSLRAEMMNAQMTHLDQVRQQAPFYVHGRLRQGHTHRGQILGASAGYGGHQVKVAADLYHPGGRWSAALRRAGRQPAVPGGAGAFRGPEDENVLYAAELGGSFFLGRFDLDASVAPVYEMNRNLEGDVFNLNAQLQLRARIGGGS